MGARLAGLTAGIAAMLVSAGAGASPAPARWTEVRSPHFVVLTDANEKQGRHVASQFERMRAVFRLLLPASGDDSDAPIEVIAVRDRKGMQALEPEAYLGKNRLDLSGFFLRGPEQNMILVRLDAEEEHAFSTVYHEYTHYILRKADGWLPLWMNEGMAEFYENTDIDEKEARLGQASPEMLRYLAQNGMLPLRTLLAVDTGSPYYHEEEKGSVFYAESWALTHYLIVSDRAAGTHRVHDYALLMAQGGDPVDAAEVAFGDLTLLQQALSVYVLQRNYTYFTMRTALSEDESSFRVRPVAGPEADAARADALVLSGRMKDARTLLDAALRDGPTCAAAHEAMGLLKQREGDLAEAKRWYGEAVELDPNDYVAQFYSGSLALHLGERGEDEAIEARLRAAMRLKQSFAPAYDALAMLYALRHKRLDEAEALVQRAIELEPESLSFRLDGADVMAEERQFSGALEELEVAQRLVRTPSEEAAVEARKKRIEEFQGR
jgi:tetratricopeptide (TPR) repeat protein